MATPASAFFDQYANPADLAFLLSNLPGSFDEVFDTAHNDPPPAATNQDEIFFVDPGESVEGGGGYDAVVQSAGNLHLDESAEAGVLSGGGGDIFGNDAKNNLVGDAGDNTLKGKDGKDVLIGNDGDDKLLGGDGKDILSGGDGDDLLRGNDGKDQLFGFAGDDKLFGGDGKDTLLGGDGGDTLFGGNGKDRLTGEDGADVFGFLRGENGTDVITDFDKDVDKIDLSDFNTRFEALRFQDSDDDVVITVGFGRNAVKFKLLGYNQDDIEKGFFTF